MNAKRRKVDWVRLAIGITLSVAAIIGSLHTTIYSNLILEQDLFHTFIVCFICFLRDQIFTKIVARPFHLDNVIERGFARILLAAIPGIAEWLYITKREYLYNPQNTTKRKRIFMKEARMEISLFVWALALVLVLSSFNFTPTPRLVLLGVAALLFASRIKNATARCQTHESKLGKALYFLAYLLLPIGERESFSALIEDIDKETL